MSGVSLLPCAAPLRPSYCRAQGIRRGGAQHTPYRKPKRSVPGGMRTPPTWAEAILTSPAARRKTEVPARKTPCGSVGTVGASPRRAPAVPWASLGTASPKSVAFGHGR
jgi:hypothetical protein